MPKKICEVLAVACTPFSAILSARKLDAPLKSSSFGRQLPTAVISSRAISSYGLLYLSVSERYFVIPSRLASDFRSFPPVRPMRILDQIVDQFRVYSSLYLSPNSESTSRSRLSFLWSPRYTVSSSTVGTRPTRSKYTRRHHSPSVACFEVPRL